jgi:phytoene dehydrogenase-like protein
MTDVVIIGAGHNGLVCAAYLARAGFSVTVAEAAEQVGGASITRSLPASSASLATSSGSDCFRVSACAHLLYQLQPEISEDLQLARHGLAFAARDMSTIALDRSGQIRKINGSTVTGTGLTQADITAYRDFHQRMVRYAGLLSRAAAVRPPRLVDSDWQDKLALARLGLRLRLLGRDDMRELLRVGAINLFDVLNETLDDPLLKGALCMDGVLGAHMGPRSPNTVLGFLYKRLAEVFGFNGPALPSGGMGAVTEALAASARSLGVEVRTGTEVERLLMAEDRASGVVLTGGERLTADLVVANADPKTTFEQLVGFPRLESGFSRRIHNLRMKGTAAKLHLALDGLPEFTGVSVEEVGDRLLIAPDMGYVERAFDPAKYGEYSIDPVMEINIPTVHDPSLAPPGKHVLTAIVQFAPYELKAGWVSARQAFTKVLIDRLAEYAPGIGELVIGSELLTPQDIEQQFRIRGGHWHHGELSLDQFMMMRPVPGATQYATPIDGLYLCGAGTHPGGGVMGLAGRNAAREIISKESS